MGIVNLIFKKDTHVESVISEIKELDTKIKQLKHAKEELINQVEPMLNDKYQLLGNAGQLVATCKPYLRNTFNQKLLKSDFPDVAEACLESKTVKGRWIWL